MNITIVAGLVLALTLAIVALLREVRLRRALQTLLRRILGRWRIRPDEKTQIHPTDRPDDHSACRR